VIENNWEKANEKLLERYLKIITECVEMDGHDFHEKTKEQVAYDKERDRAIKLAGYEIIHFSGSEIYKNPSRVIAKIFQFMESMILKNQ
jgi:very-short-patch-repair endonuclease